MASSDDDELTTSATAEPSGGPSGGVKRKDVDSEEEQEGKGKGTGKGKGKGKAKQNGNMKERKAQKAGGRPTTAKAGMKECVNCGKTKTLAEFKPGAAMCTFPCNRMLENLYRACKKENVLDYWEKIKNNQSEKKKALRWYQVRCPQKKDEADKTKMKAFPILQLFGSTLKKSISLSFSRVSTFLFDVEE